MQTVELNRGRTEARCLIPFAATAEQVCFPGVEQAARLTRCTDSEQKSAQEIETEWLISSRPAHQLDAQQMLQADRRYWGIENPFHFRLDVIAREDDSRVRHRTSALNLALMRRAVQSVAAHWITCCRNTSSRSQWSLRSPGSPNTREKPSRLQLPQYPLPTAITNLP